EAPRHHQAPGPAALLLPRHLQDGVHGLLLGAVDEGAGVHDDHVGGRRVRHHLVAAGLELADHDLAVDQVLGAAEADEADGASIAQWALSGVSIWLPHSRSFSRSLLA